MITITIPAILLVAMCAAYIIESVVEQRERDKADAYRYRQRIERGW